MISRRFAVASVFFFALFAVSSIASVDFFSPQGEVARIRQVTARFAEQMVNFGDPRARDPFDISCMEKGVGRWIDGRNWSYDFDRDLPAGLRCEFSLKPKLRSLRGTPVVAERPFIFTTGGPKIVRTWPSRGYGTIKEQQAFLVELNVPATEASVREHAHCRIVGSDADIPVTLLADAEVKAIEKRNLISAKDVLPRLGLKCRDAFESSTRFQLVWGKSVAARTGVASERDQLLDFVVRDPFTARVECNRYQAIEGCNPASPISLYFTAPVPRAVAEKARLKMVDGSLRAPQSIQQSGSFLYSVQFDGPFAENSDIVIELPKDVRDEDERVLTNATNFPQTLRIGEPAPAIRFPAQFGIIERNAGSALPVELQNVEESVMLRRLRVGGSRRFPDDAEIIEWMMRFNRANNYQQRDRSLLADVSGAEADAVRKRLGPKARENALIALAQPGYYIVELESARHAQYSQQARYVRAAALVTNLAVHFKYGSENAVVWVTQIDNAKPVEGASVVVRDCKGRSIWEGRTNARGLARIERAMKDTLANTESCDSAYSGYYVSARTADDFAFTLTQWQYYASQGNYGYYRGYRGYVQQTSGWAVHTVLDRTLFRAGEAVSMKHYVRRETLSGLAYADRLYSSETTITHLGTNKSYRVPLVWDAAGTGLSNWKIPEDAKLGTYLIRTIDGYIPDTVSGTFRVEEFRLPTMRAELRAGAPQYFNASEVPYELRLAYLSGGAAQQSVKLRSVLTPRFVNLEGYEDFVFAGPNRWEPPKSTTIVDALKVDLNEKGEARTIVKNLPPIDAPAILATEVEFADANGEIQTVSSVTRLSPAAVLLGMKQRRPLAGDPAAIEVQTVALDLDGKFLPDAEVRVEMALRNIRYEPIVGPNGVESHKTITEDTPLGVACAGRTDARGMLICIVKPERSGQLVFAASARDPGGNQARGFITVYYSRERSRFAISYGAQGTQVDLYPDRVNYRSGETAKLQFDVPYDKTTVLITTEREGIAEARVETFDAGKREFEIPIRATYAPNVYVSVLMLVGRRGDGNVTEVGDPDKPLFFYGQRDLRVAPTAYELSVQVTADREVYRPREAAKVRVKVLRPDGAPARGAETVLVAVDDALLQLTPNSSWKLLDAMLKHRQQGVRSGTAISQVIGRRAIPNVETVGIRGSSVEAKPAASPIAGFVAQRLLRDGSESMEDVGGPPRELFDTLLKWQARVRLDDNGEATVDVPLNDSLTAFRIVAVAHLGVEQFGTSDTLVRSSTPLEIVTGLPPLVREGDAFRAMATLRNTDDQPMRIEFTAKARRITGSASSDVANISRNVELKSGESREISWPMTVPVNSERLEWELTGRNLDGAARDQLRVSQKVIPAVPVTVQQATLTQLDGKLDMKVALPGGAIPGRGGVSVNLRAKLGDGLDGVRRMMSLYPYRCLEQQVSRAIALRDEAAWQRVMGVLGSYLDGDGLASYFPGSPYGSDALTAYLLAIAHEANWQIPQELRARMIAGLTGVVEDRTLRNHWAPQSDLGVRKIGAIEALSRYGVVRQEMLQRVHIEPNAWPTSAVIDWLGILRRLNTVPRRNELLAEAQQILRARLNLQGTTMGFSTERSDYLWWLMVSPDSNAVRTILALLDDTAWKEDLPRMVRGALQRQRHGHWATTTANAWGVLAMEKFSRRFESQAVTGTTQASLAGKLQVHEWKGLPTGGDFRYDWPANAGNLHVEQRGAGKPWVTVQSLAAVPLKVPFSSGYKIVKRIALLQQKTAGSYSRGDVLRVTLDLEAQSDMSWVVVNDPVPAGATLLGRGFGRDSTALAAGEQRKGWVWPAYEERAMDAFRAYYAFVPKGKWSVEYTVRLNNDGTFELPQTRVEAMYAPEMFGEMPNSRVVVKQ